MIASVARSQIARRAALLALVAGAPLLSACGEKAEPEPPVELSRAALVQRGDAICEQAQRDSERASSGQLSSAADNARLVGELISISGEELRRLGELEPPDELAQPLAAYLASREDAVALLREARGAAEADEAFEFARIRGEIADSQPQRTRLAGEVGFESCSRVSDVAAPQAPAAPETGSQQGDGQSGQAQGNGQSGQAPNQGGSQGAGAGN